MRATGFKVWLLGAVLAGACSSANAQVTNAWTALGNGKWEIGANWSFGLPSDGVPFQQVRPVGGIGTVITVDDTTVASNELTGCMTISNLLVTGTSGTLGRSTTLAINNANNGLAGFNIFAVLNEATITSRGSVTITNSTMRLGYSGGTLSIDGSLLLDTGSLITSNAGFSSISNDVVIVGNTGSGQMTVLDGTWLAGIVVVGNALGSDGTLTLAGGTTSFSLSELSFNMNIGSPLNGAGAVWMTGGQLLNAKVDIANGGGPGQMSVSNGTWRGGSVLTGQEGGTLTIAGGNISVDAIENSGTNWITGGQLAASVIDYGLITMSNGVWYAAGGNVDYGGTLKLVGGQMMVTNSPLEIGADIDSVGFLDLLSSTFSAGEVNLGVGDQAEGYMTMVGGSAVIGSLNLGQYRFEGPLPGSGRGELTMAGGTLTVLSTLVVGQCASNAFGIVSMTGGTLYVTNAAHNAVLEVDEGSTFLLEGGTLVVDQLMLNGSYPCISGGLFDQTGGTLTYGTLLLNPDDDTDGDGLPNWWEQLYGLDPLSSSGDNGPDGDSDGDGYTNLQEYLAGSDPLNPLSTPLHPVAPPFQITSMVQSGNNIILTWNAVGGITNQVQVTSGGTSGSYSTNGFTNLGAQMIIGGAAVTTTNYTDLGGATNKPARYYRIGLVP